MDYGMDLLLTGLVKALEDSGQMDTAVFGPQVEAAAGGGLNTTVGMAALVHELASQALLTRAAQQRGELTPEEAHGQVMEHLEDAEHQLLSGSLPWFTAAGLGDYLVRRYELDVPADEAVLKVLLNFVLGLYGSLDRAEGKLPDAVVKGYLDTELEGLQRTLLGLEPADAKTRQEEREPLFLAG